MGEWCPAYISGTIANVEKGPLKKGFEHCSIVHPRRHPASSKMLPTATPIQTAVKAPNKKFQGQRRQAAKTQAKNPEALALPKTQRSQNHTKHHEENRTKQKKHRKTNNRNPHFFM